MYCKHCGNQIDNGAKFCSSCGAKVSEDEEVSPFDLPPSAPYRQSYYSPPPPPPPPAQNDSTNENMIAVIGFVLSFFISVAGLVCSIIGYQNAQKGGKYKGFAIAGIAVSITSIVISVIASIASAIFLSDLYGYLYDYAYALNF